MHLPIRTFGPTGERLLALGVGTHGHGHAFGGISREQSMEVLDQIYRSVPADQRLLIDTAPRYGHGLVESWIGERSASLSDRFLIATKCGRRIDPQRDNQKDFSYDFLAQDIENSLTRLRANRLFLVQPPESTVSSGQVH